MEYKKINIGQEWLQWFYSYNTNFTNDVRQIFWKIYKKTLLSYHNFAIFFFVNILITKHMEWSQDEELAFAGLMQKQMKCPTKSIEERKYNVQIIKTK